MLQLRVDLKSFYYKYIKNSIENIRLLLGDNPQIKAVPSRVVVQVQPTILKKYTLLRSPHIDKKSREQFEIRRYKTQILILSSSSSAPPCFGRVLYLLKNSLFPGVEVQLLVHYSCFFIIK